MRQFGFLEARGLVSKHALWWLGAIVLLGLYLRLRAVGQLGAAAPYSIHQLTGDEPSYMGLARGLLAHQGFISAERPPGYPVWLALALKVTGGSQKQVLVLQAFLGTLSIPLTYVLGRQLLGPGATLLAALGVATSSALVHESSQFLSEVLFTPAVLVATIALVHALRHPTPRWLALAGAAIGVTVLIHSTLLLFPFGMVIVLWLLHRHRRASSLRGAAALLVGTALVVVPWMVHVRQQFGGFTVASSNAIVWLGSPEYESDVNRLGYLGVFNKIVDGEAGLRHPDYTLAGDGWWTRRGERSIEAHPLSYIWFAIRKAAYVWVGDPHADWDNTHVFDIAALHRVDSSWGTTLHVLWDRVLIFVALAGAILLRRRWKDFIVLYAMLIYATLVCAATASVARLGDPFHPLLFVIAAGGLAEAFRRGVARRTQTRDKAA